MRPFYLIGHNTNSVAEIREGLGRGLNAFEVDVNSDNQGQLYISHGAVSAPRLWLPGVAAPPPLVSFLTELKALAASAEGASIALVIFDCKVGEGELASELMNAVREHLTDQGTSLHVIYSVPSVSRAETFFDPIRTRLTNHEGLMIDEEDDPETVAAFFARRSIGRAAYGNGISTAMGIGLPSPRLVAQMDRAVALAAVDCLRFVYPWVLVQPSTIREFIRIGVNGAMVDTDQAEVLEQELADSEFAHQLRAAVREDDPLAVGNGLLLEVTTAHASFAGTDATVTFSLATADGNVFSRSVDATLNHRFERQTVTYITFVGMRLEPGHVRSITVSHDGEGLGPDWHLVSITLRARGAETKHVVFDCELTRDTSVTRRL